MAVEIVIRNVNVPFDKGSIEGFVAEPDGLRDRPTVLVIHEWWGLNDHMRDVVCRLAAAGFAAIAPDLFDGRKTTDPEIAGSMMAGLDQHEVLSKLSATITFVRQERRGDVGVIGFCMGGSYSLLLPTSNEHIRAAVPFYGQVPGNDQLRKIGSPVLYIYAGKDQWITKAEVDRLDAFFKETGKRGEIVCYPNCEHAFFNDTRPEVYDPKAAVDAWEKALGFLRKNLN